MVNWAWASSGVTAISKFRILNCFLWLILYMGCLPVAEFCDLHISYPYVQLWPKDMENHTVLAHPLYLISSSWLLLEPACHAHWPIFGAKYSPDSALVKVFLYLFYKSFSLLSCPPTCLALIRTSVTRSLSLSQCLINIDKKQTNE